MQIFTSYYASKKYNISKAVAISAYIPKGISIDICNELVPPKNIIFNYKNGFISKETFRMQYIALVLDKLDVDEMYMRLRGKVLLCYEKEGDFCHRHIVSEWFRKAGYRCNEL